MTWQTLLLPLVALIACIAARDVGAAEPATFLLTADTQGHVEPVYGGPSLELMGGLSRRATVLANLRKQAPNALLIDAGNSLFGADSAGSGGGVIIAGYNALGYDAVNLSYRDFRAGKEATLNALKAATFPILSANLLDD